MSSRQFFQVQPRAKYVAATTSERLAASVLLTFPSRNILEEKTARVTASGQAPVSISKIINQHSNYRLFSLGGAKEECAK